jgi:ATP-dependent DNA ligase
MPRLAFIRPLSPSAAVRPPKGDDWLHEPKWDGFRFQVIKDGSDVGLYSKSGADYSSKLPSMRKAFVELPTNSAILDGELCLIDPRGRAHFYWLMHQMRTRWPEEGLLLFLAFDLLHQDGVDLRSLSLTERKRDLDRLCRQAHAPFLKQVETFPDGKVLFDHCNQFGFEGVVSKRRASGYTSGPSRHWVKVKCPDWKRDNSERHRMFEESRKPELTEAQRTLAKKRQELARVIDRLRSPGLSPGMARV